MYVCFFAQAGASQVLLGSCRPQVFLPSPLFHWAFLDRGEGAFRATQVLIGPWSSQGNEVGFLEALCSHDAFACSASRALCG